MPKSEAEIEQQNVDTLKMMVDQIAALQLAVQVMAETRPDRRSLQQAMKTIRHDINSDDVVSKDQAFMKVVDDAERLLGFRKSG
ncbi:hypothetical protein [Stenotrophomonas acidaminiphila]|jgi:hypothetical protein|uniref:hypothetical protein n=1 Tax=Stenotrophomonas acidaminiphila TaxID=128780 RepID=UPI0024AE4770|nr:hypothetical protein [Stenotrophomonas acidaminiphila]WHL17662.1 hypothetical protein QLF99_11325 [Stenotrophomonas acidaminiphila]